MKFTTHMAALMLMLALSVSAAQASSSNLFCNGVNCGKISLSNISGGVKVTITMTGGYTIQAKANNGTLDCAVNRVEGRPPQHRCRLNEADVDALSRTAEYFQIKLPRALLTADNSPVEVHWVDQWR